MNNSVFQLLEGSGVASLETKITTYLISFIFFHSGFGLWETLPYISVVNGIWSLWKKSLSNKHIECNKYYCMVKNAFHFFYFYRLHDSKGRQETALFSLYLLKEESVNDACFGVIFPLVFPSLKWFVTQLSVCAISFWLLVEKLCRSSWCLTLLLYTVPSWEFPFPLGSLSKGCQSHQPPPVVLGSSLKASVHCPWSVKMLVFSLVKPKTTWLFLCHLL